MSPVLNSVFFINRVRVLWRQVRLFPKVSPSVESGFFSSPGFVRVRVRDRVRVRSGFRSMPGVLQGDCLSPLLFNTCFNTFVQHIKVEKYRQFGFSFKPMNPVHWFQYADDAAIITTQESENQHLLNRFPVWCQWSNMFAQVEKCSTFGIHHKI